MVEPLPIAGAWRVTPHVHGDARGMFFEWFKSSVFTEAVGHSLNLAQANCSVSSRGTLRGIHYADVPPGQAKYVACLSGGILDVIVDIRVGSPTFGEWISVELSSQSREMVYLSEGLGHGFVALEDNSLVTYLCSTEYNPAAEHEIDPFDLDLAVEWGISRHEASLSPKDASAPGLQEVQAAGGLPVYESCIAFTQSLPR